MGNIRTVADLIAELEELPSNMPIMAQHQATYPLREVIGGIWIDDGKDEDACNAFTEGENSEEIEDGEGCYNCGLDENAHDEKPEDEQVAYIVLNGHPYEGSPYGNKDAWANI